MSGPISAVIDACVLVNFSLCDTLLRIAEPPPLFEPRWSDEILAETVRTLRSKLDWPESLTDSLQSELRAHFGDAWISGYEPLIPQMRNDPKDRHVLAAAAHAGAEVIVTFNLRHFPLEHTAPWRVRVHHPDDLLLEFLREDRGLVLAKLENQARDRRRDLDGLLNILRRTVPRFAAAVRGT